jgi:hypothetical protein
MANIWKQMKLIPIKHNIFTPTMEVIHSTEALFHLQTTWRYIPEDGKIHNYHC